MSVWCSVGETSVALNGRDKAANYRGEGVPSIEVDVATTAAHDGIRLALWETSFPKGGINVDAILSEEMATRLRDNLSEVLEHRARTRKQRLDDAARASRDADTYDQPWPETAESSPVDGSGNTLP